MNNGQLQTAVLARIQMGNDDPSAVNAQILVNEGLHLVEVSATRGWPWLTQLLSFTTTASTRTYTFATLQSTYEIAKILDIKVLRDTTYQALTIVSPNEADRTYNSTNSQFPVEYFVEGETVYLVPTPDGTYTCQARVIVTENDLVLDADEPLMPSRYHGSIVTAAMMIYYQVLQDSNRVAVAQQQLDGWIKRMVGNSPQYNGPLRVQVRDWMDL